MWESARPPLGRIREIEEALDQFLQRTGRQDDPATLLEHASLLSALHRFREARPILERLLSCADASHLLPAAKLLFQTGRFGDSARFTARALKHDPGNADIAAMHAASLERAGETDEARSVLEHTLQQHPAHARSVRLLAHLDRRANDFEQARTRLENHLRHRPSPEDWRLRYELAPILDRLGEFGEAIRNLSIAKHQIQPQSQTFQAPWRAITDRQWELTTALDRARLDTWNATAEALPSRLSICLVAGFPRSGTTLLERVLTSHPGCLGTDETGILATRFRNPLALTPPSAVEAMAGLDSLTPDDLAAGRAEYLRSTEEFIDDELGDRILLEKDPLHTADLVVPLRLFPEAKILMPLRDPRDVVISFFFTIVPLAPNSVASANLADTCRYYAEILRHWIFLRDFLHPSRWMESRYEDLLAQPEEQTKQLTSFLDLDWSPVLLEHHKHSAGKTVTTPTYDDVAKPLYSRSVGRWENYRKWIEPHLHHLEPYLDAFNYR